MKKKLVFIMCAAIVLCACTRQVLPPQAKIPDNFRSEPETRENKSNLPCIAWWQQFHDAELTRIIHQSLQQNPDLQIVLLNSQKAEAELQKVKLAWLPDLPLLAGYSTYPGFGVPDGFVGAFPAYFMNLLQQYEKQKIAKTSVDHARVLIAATRLIIISEVIKSWFTLLAEKEELRLIKILVADRQKLVKFSRDDVQIGLKDDIELYNKKVDLDESKAMLLPVAQNVVVSQNALQFLLSRNPGILHTDKRFTQLDFTNIMPGSLPITVLRQRPDLKMAELDIKIAARGIKISQGELFPVMNVQEFVGIAHLPRGELAQFTNAFFSWNLMPTTIGAINVSKAKTKIKIAEYEKLVVKILEKVDNAYSANEKLREYYLKTKKAESDYCKKYKLQQNLYKTGLISYKNLIENKIELDKLAIKTNTAKLLLALSLVNLYQELAGGYAANA